jgi:ribonuclease Z
MLRVTFLGTSGSTPTVERAMPSIAIKYQRELLLWDCGEGTQRQLMRYKVGFGSVNAIFITHPHLDHFIGIYGLLETLKLSSVSPKPISVFIPKGMEVGGYDFATVSAMKSGVLYKGAGFTVSAYPVKHSRASYGLVFQENEKIKFHEKKAHSLGLKGRLFTEIQRKGRVKTAKGEVRLEDVTWVKPGRKIVYTGDCVPDTNTIKAAKGADLLIHEGTFDASLKDEAEERMHSTVEGAASVAKKAKVKKLIVTHISPRYSEVSALLEQARKIFPKAEIAKDGLTVEIP